MNLKTIDIVFDNPHCTYYAGQQVTGRVVLRPKQAKKIRGVCLCLKGEAEVKFQEAVTVKRRWHSYVDVDDYHAHEVYVDTETWLIGASDGEMVLPPGEHEYPFSCGIPMNVPSSFEGKRGYVRYTVKVKIDRPDMPDYEKQVTFTVLNLMDLNMEDKMLEPVYLTKEKFVCCCCFQIGPIVITVKAVRSYVPGQRIEAQIELNNETRGEISLMFFLEKLERYHAKFGTERRIVHDKYIVAEKSIGRVGSNSSDSWRVDFEIPPLPPSYLKYCGCIEVYYYFVLRGKLPGYLEDIYISIPIVIGTVPHKRHFKSIISSQSSAEIPDLSDSDRPATVEDEIALSAPTLEPVTPYSDMPQPSYEECVQGVQDKKYIAEDEKEKRKLVKSKRYNKNHVLVETKFVPRYPVYKFGKK